MTDEQTLLSRGRQIRLEPMPPGLWGVVLGVGLAMLAPLAGFLIGSILGVGDGTGLSPLVVWLTVGIAIGGVGLVAACFAGVRLYRHLHATPEN